MKRKVGAPATRFAPVLPPGAIAPMHMKCYHDVINYDNDRPARRRVSEPVQVYLHPSERDRLERLTAELDTTKSDVLRRGLEALEGQLSDPARHPALGVIGIVSTADDEEIDVAREHDRYLAATEIASWSKGSRRRGWRGSE